MTLATEAHTKARTSGRETVRRATVDRWNIYLFPRAAHAWHIGRRL
jgi:hypothetical protein